MGVAIGHRPWLIGAALPVSAPQAQERIDYTAIFTINVVGLQRSRSERSPAASPASSVPVAALEHCGPIVGALGNSMPV